MDFEPDPFINWNINWVLDPDPFMNQNLKEVLDSVFYGSEALDNRKIGYPFASLVAFMVQKFKSSL